MMKKIIIAIIMIAGVFINGMLAGWVAREAKFGSVSDRRSNGQSERVELVTWRTQLPHEGCASNGCWCLNGQPRKITAYGIDKCVWPHRCDGCGATNEIYDAQWPRFRREWRAVK